METETSPNRLQSEVDCSASTVEINFSGTPKYTGRTINGCKHSDIELERMLHLILPDMHSLSNPVQIGRGGQAFAYAMNCLKGRGEVVVKVLKQDACPERYGRRVDMFRKEAHVHRMVAAKKGGVAHFYEEGIIPFEKESDRIHYFVMEFLKGGNFAGLVRRAQNDLAGVLHCFYEAALALHGVHEMGYVHGDINPVNIRMCSKGSAKLIDLGLAREIGAVNQEGIFYGTPEFVAPEIVAPKSSAHPVSDIFSLGVVLYEVLSGGRHPYTGQNVKTMRLFEPIEIIRANIRGDYIPIQTWANIDKNLAGVVENCLQKEPWARYMSARELADDLSQCPDFKSR